jgi:hypothetical protein
VGNDESNEGARNNVSEDAAAGGSVASDWSPRQNARHLLEHLSKHLRAQRDWSRHAESQRKSVGLPCI